MRCRISRALLMLFFFWIGFTVGIAQINPEGYNSALPSTIRFSYEFSTSNNSMVLRWKDIIQTDSSRNAEIHWYYVTHGSNNEFLVNRNTTHLDSLGRANRIIVEAYKGNGIYDTLNTREFSYFGNGDLQILEEWSYPDSCTGSTWKYYYELDSLNRRTFYRYDRMDTWNCIEDTAFSFLVYSRYANMLRVDTIYSIDFHQTRLQIDSILYDSAGRISVHREIFPTDTNNFGKLLETQHRYHYRTRGLIDSIETLHNGPIITVNGFNKAYSHVYRYDSLDREVFASYRSFISHNFPYYETITVYDTMLFVSSIEAKHALDKYIVYPNPVNDFLNIKTETDVSEELQVIFTDINGNNFSLTPEDNGLSFRVSQLKPGVYFYRIESDNGIKRGKFIKQ